MCLVMIMQSLQRESGAFLAFYGAMEDVSVV